MMTRDDWHRVKTIAGDAWALPAPGRPAFIAAACGTDDELAREVAALVGSMGAAEHLFEQPAPLPAEIGPLVASLVGRRLGAYEIRSAVGAGGGGEVYKARDTRLNRTVAIKVLPAAAHADAVPYARIEREAHAVAALKHPHICTLYDVGREDGLEFLVMEYLDGETLAERLQRGALPIAETLDYAAQIADALLEAHRQGIVHRDIKPANIMLEPARSRSGGASSVKLLDFGVAKMRSREPVRAAPDGGLHVGTDVTLAGQIAGTPSYMAPERFDGGASDARVDVFAFGAVLFEMLTATKAFDASTHAAIPAAKPAAEAPRVSSLRRGVPASLDRLVARSVARDPAQRYEDFAQLIPDLRRVQHEIGSAFRFRGLAVGAAAAALTIAGLAGWRANANRGPQAGESPMLVSLAASAGALGAPALSPDGSRVAFSSAVEGTGNPELMLLPVGSTTRVQLTSDPGVEEWPTWSPDCRRIAFIRCGAGRCAIWSLPVAGGPEVKLRDLRDDRYFGLAWSPDGRSIAFAERASRSAPYAIFVLSVAELTVRQVTRPASGVGDLRFAFSPDSRMLGLVRVGDRIAVRLLRLDTGTERLLLGGQQEWFGGLAWTADGRELIVSANQRGVRRLWRLPADGGPLEQLAVAGENSYYPSVSPSGGRLAFVHQFDDWDLTRVTLRARGAAPEVPFAASARVDLDPAFSPDGRKLAFVSERGGTREVWVSDADGTHAAQLTSLGGSEAGRPSWSPDGQWLAFHAAGIRVIPAQGGPSTRIAENGEAPSWSADGRWVYFTRPLDGHFRIFKTPSTGGEAIQVIASEASMAREGSDGYVYFAAARGGLWRVPATGGSEERVIPDFDWSLAGFWSVAADGLYYLVREPQPDRTFINHVKRSSFGGAQPRDICTLAGEIDPWVGAMTISPDRRTVVYVRRTYESSEVMLIDRFR